MSAREPLLTYELRSSAAYKAGLVLAAAVGLAPVVILAAYGLPPAGAPLLWLLGALLLLTPVVLGLGARTYLVPGGRGELRLYPEELELWTPRLTRRFPLSELQVHVTRHVTRYSIALIPAGSQLRDVHIELRAGGVRHPLSRRLFSHPKLAEALLADIERLRGGEAPRGIPFEEESYEEMKARDPERAELEEKLDAELDAMD